MNHDSGYDDPPSTYSLYPEHVQLWEKLDDNTLSWIPWMNITCHVDLSPITITRDDLAAVVKALPSYLYLLNYVQSHRTSPLNEDLRIPEFFLKTATEDMLFGLVESLEMVNSQIIEHPAFDWVSGSQAVLRPSFFGSKRYQHYNTHFRCLKLFHKLEVSYANACLKEFYTSYSSQLINQFCGRMNIQPNALSAEGFEKCLRDFRQNARRMVNVCDRALETVLSESFMKKSILVELLFKPPSPEEIDMGNLYEYDDLDAEF